MRLRLFVMLLVVTVTESPVVVMLHIFAQVSNPYYVEAMVVIICGGTRREVAGACQDIE